MSRPGYPSRHAATPGTLPGMRRRGRAIAIAAGVAALVAPAAALADDGFPGFLNPTPLGPNTRLATNTVAKARAAVGRRWASCRLRAPTPDPPTDGPVPADLLAAFGVLRRAQTPQEAELVDAWASRRPLLVPASGVLRSSARIARTLPDGTQVQLYVATSPFFPRPRPEVCRTRELRVVRRGSRALPAKARRAALRMERRAALAERRLATLPATPPGLFLSVRTASGASAGGGNWSVDTVRRAGPVETLSQGRHTVVAAVVPDGVAQVELVFARGRNPLTGHRFVRSLHRTLAVADNVVVGRVARGVEDAIVVRQIWRAADGTVVNRIRVPA
jgi:hypothetical protein